ncbi:RNA recognition motif domain - like 10 [Theobroma cacao]|nr:RNA recognition motif domain - like 10 [Theobroma cacao]
MPERVDGSWLQRIFEGYGDVKGVFMAQRRSRTRRRFEFIRFYRLVEAREAVMALNGIWLLNKRIRG